jgi:hypothetical protein
MIMLGQCWCGSATLQAMTKRWLAAAWLIRWLAQVDLPVDLAGAIRGQVDGGIPPGAFLVQQRAAEKVDALVRGQAAQAFHGGGEGAGV